MDAVVWERDGQAVANDSMHEILSVKYNKDIQAYSGVLSVSYTTPVELQAELGHCSLLEGIMTCKASYKCSANVSRSSILLTSSAFVQVDFGKKHYYTLENRAI